MVKMDVLISAIVLLYRERENGKEDEINSGELVKSILSVSKGKKRELGYYEGGVIDLNKDVVDFINKMIDDTSLYNDATTLLGELKILFKDNTAYYDSIKDQITAEMTDGGRKRSTNTLRNKLHKYYNEMTIVNHLNRLSFNLSNGKVEKSIQEDLMAILPELEALCKKTRTNDPGLMDTLSLSSTDDIANVQKKLLEEKEEGGVLKTGWKQLNKMIDGGFYKGETTMMCALQHNYKSGFTQSLVMQVARHNKPRMKDPEKKPAIMYISLEDDIEKILKFMYRYLFYNENKELPDGTDQDLTMLTPDQIREYINTRVGRTGYEVILLRADPALWSYHDIISTINRYEANGYEVHALFIDYINKLPTIGCENNGVPGNAIRDLWNRLRNVCSARRIALCSPCQLSTEAKILTRNGVSDLNFVKEIAGKGYLEGSKQIDQVVDLEIYLHKAKLNRKPVLTVQRGKHRGHPILPEDALYFILPFPPGAPILENINGESEGIELEDEGLNTEDVFNI